MTINKKERHLSLSTKDRALQVETDSIKLSSKWIINGNRKWLDNKLRKEEENIKNKENNYRNNLWQCLPNLLGLFLMARGLGRRWEVGGKSIRGMRKNKGRRKWRDSIWRKKGREKERKKWPNKIAKIKKHLVYLWYFSCFWCFGPWWKTFCSQNLCTHLVEVVFII